MNLPMLTVILRPVLERHKLETLHNVLFFVSEAESHRTGKKVVSQPAKECTDRGSQVICMLEFWSLLSLNPLLVLVVEQRHVTQQMMKWVVLPDKLDLIKGHHRQEVNSEKFIKLYLLKVVLSRV